VTRSFTQNTSLAQTHCFYSDDMQMYIKTVSTRGHRPLRPDEFWQMAGRAVRVMILRIIHRNRRSIHRRLIYKGVTSTHAQKTDPKVALGAYGELPGIYLDAWGRSRRRDPSGRLRRRPAAPRVPLGQQQRRRRITHIYLCF